MRHVVLCLVCIVAALPVPAVHAEDGYTVRLHEPAIGERWQVDKDETLIERVEYRDSAGRGVGIQDHVGGEVSIYTETVLARDPEQPASQLRRAYETALTREGGLMRPLVYDGGTVLIERKNKKYHFELSGQGALTNADATFLRREFQLEHERFGLANLIPGNPVRAGRYPWTVNMAPLVQDFGRTGKLLADPVRSTGTGQLLRVWRDEDGHLFGEFTYQLEMAMTAIKLGQQRVAARPGGKAITQMKIELCIDGSIFHLKQESSTHIAAVGPFQLPDGSIGLVAITAAGESKGSTKTVPPKKQNAKK